MSYVEKNLYEMKLHEMARANWDQNGAVCYDVMRVPGGWIYTMFDKSKESQSSVFVEYHNEFQGEPNDT